LPRSLLYGCLTAVVLLGACVAVPVPVGQTVSDGRQFTDSDLSFVRSGTTTRSEVIINLGNPTLWFSSQRTLVYGLRRVETGVLWFIAAGPVGAGGLVEGETKEAIFLVLDDKDIVTNWGRAAVKGCDTWLSAGREWADSRHIELPPARERFIEEPPTPEQALVYFYRPRDFQHVLPAVPPAERLMLDVADYADISQDGELVGQIRWQSYVVVRVPPGTRSFTINPDTDCVVNPENYRSATIQLDLARGAVAFIDVGIRAGLGTIEPIIVSRPRSDAIPVIEKLRESW
jgi:hypothetical protein